MFPGNINSVVAIGCTGTSRELGRSNFLKEKKLLFLQIFSIIDGASRS